MLPKTRAALQKNMRKEATSLPVAMEAQIKTRTRQLALRAVSGDFDQLDLDNLDALGRITGDLANTYIESVSAAKITSATMLATTLTLAGTDASNNKTSLVMIGDAMMRVNDGTADRIKISNAGLEIDAADNESSASSGVIGRGVFNTDAHWTGIWPFTNVNRRGWQIRADGVAGSTPQGNIRLVATRGSGNIATDTGSWASAEMNVEGSGVGVISGYAGVIVRNMLWVVGPARVAGALDVTGAVVASGNVNISGNIPDVGNINMRSAGRYQNDGTAATFGGSLTTTSAIVSGAGITSNTGNFASPSGVALDVIGSGAAVNLRGSVIKSIAAFRAESGLVVLGASSLQGLTVSGALSLPTNSVDNVMLSGSSTDDTKRAVSINHLQASLRNPAWDDYGARTIASLLGGTVNSVASGNHSHGSGNTMDFDMLGDARVEKILQLRDALRARKNATGAVSRQEYNGLLALTLVLAHILFDAPDLSADERLAKRKAGETGWDDFMFEWRRGKQLGAAAEGQDEYLHHPSLKHYANPTPDVTDIPA